MTITIKTGCHIDIFSHSSTTSVV